MRWTVVISQYTAMARGRGFYVVLALALLGDALSIPAGGRPGNQIDPEDEIQAWLAGYGNEIKELEPAKSENRVARDDGTSNDLNGVKTSNDINGVRTSIDMDNKDMESRIQTTTAKSEFATPVNDDDDDDDDEDFDSMNTAPSGGGSNLFSLLRIATALFPSSSGGNIQPFVMRILERYINQLNTNEPTFNANPNYLRPYYPTNSVILRRMDIDTTENRIDTDEIQGLKPPPFQRQETEESESNNNNDSSGNTNSDSDDSKDQDDSDDESDQNNAAESISEEDDNVNGNNNNNNASRQKSGSIENGKASDESNSDYSEEPEGDGQGGGILGILAGLSGGEDGQSDLGSLLATVSGIVANLSGGEGFDLNAIIGSGVGLFVGLLSQGNENPGEVIASYLLASLDSITGGGSKNNGAFFGKFLSKLLKGSSAGIDPEASSEEGKEPEKDSIGFFKSFLIGLLGDMSKGSSTTSSCSSDCQPESGYK